MNELKIIRYNPDFRDLWDKVVRESKNATFLLQRGYMDYHSDRFSDHSLIFQDNSDKIVTLLPACEKDGKLISHGGLTYGGFVMSDKTSGVDPMHWMTALTIYMKEQGLKELIYKPVPHFYHLQPAEEDLYALFRFGATLEVRNLATVIDIQNPLASSRLGKRAIKRAARFGLKVEETDDLESFWHIIEEDRRVRHNTRPVHTLDEMKLLHSRFPKQIRLFVTLDAHERIIAGAVVYADHGVLHLQYAAADEQGKDQYAVDAIYHTLIYDLFKDMRYFDFGTSNEDAGQYLNEGMVAHKEEFGGRSIAYDTYKLTI